MCRLSPAPGTKSKSIAIQVPVTKTINSNKSTKLLSWKEERQQQIDALNDRVKNLTQQAIATSKSSGKPLALEYVHAQQPMTTLVAGTPVYQLRSAIVVYVYSCLSVVLVLVGMIQLSITTSVLSIITIFIGYDLYSGILHVVLDHPSNIALPILGQPCLEFQWHHAIPDDLVRKSFIDVCGDLNVVVLIVIGINLCLLDLEKPSGVAFVIGGMKLFMAYFGQFSHMSAHAFSKSRKSKSMAVWLQKYGFMISPKEHMAHHKPPHDLDFCLIGLCNPIIDLLRKITTNNMIWLIVFLIWTIFDIYVYVKLIEGVTSIMS